MIVFISSKLAFIIVNVGLFTNVCTIILCCQLMGSTVNISYGVIFLEFSTVQNAKTSIIFDKPELALK